MPFRDDPAQVRPDAALVDTLRRLGACAANAVVVVSGRGRDTLEEWLGSLPVCLVAEHGAWVCDRPQGTWRLQEPMAADWKDGVREVLDGFVDRTPGAFLEEKDCSLVWHYRACSPEVAERRIVEIKGMLAETLEGRGLALMDGNKVIEVKPRGIDKGRAASRWLSDPSFDFLLAAGDDRTDEDVFEAAPQGAWTIHVGGGPTAARYALEGPAEMRALLHTLASLSS